MNQAREVKAKEREASLAKEREAKAKGVKVRDPTPRVVKEREENHPSPRATVRGTAEISSLLSAREKVVHLLSVSSTDV